LHPDRRDDTVRRLLDADATRTDNARTATADQAVADAEQRLRRLHAAIEAGVDPVALVEPINSAQEELEAARFEQQCVPTAPTLGQAEVEAMLDHLGDVGEALQRADPAKL
jgi:predicted transcriptional regulator